MNAMEIAGGSVTGRAHTHARRNNQDALHRETGDGVMVALVADGCGSGLHSEVGAKAGVRMLAGALRREAGGDGPPDVVLERARLALVDDLRTLALALGGHGPALPAVVADYLLFTLVGAVLTRERTTVFALGDGLVYVNGERFGLEAADDTPPYAAYALTGSSLTETRPDLLRFRILKTLPTPDVESILLGTDGAAHLERGGESLPALFADDRVFANPFTLTRWLNRANAPGRSLLPDDTTLVLLRRRERCRSTSTARG